MFSIETIRVFGVWKSSYSRAAERIWSAPIRPLSPTSGRVTRPANAAGPPSSAIRTWECSSASSSSPGSPCSRSAISFAIVAVGT